MKIVVVCAGNTCRSPAAEAAIRRAARNAGISLEVSSAGTGAGQVGQPATPAMVEAARARGLEISTTARQVTARDLESADLVLALDTQTELFLRSLTTAAPIRLLGSYDAAAAIDEIADPFGRDSTVYADTLDRIIAASDALVTSLID